MNIKTYRVEYNDNQKKFFLNENEKCRENTNGYITIFNSITCLGFEVFEAYLLAMRDKSEWSDKFVKGSARSISRFTKNLLNRNIIFSKI